MTDQERKGLSALYSFTPFKIRQADPYQLILIQVSYLQTLGEYFTGMSTANKDEFTVPLEDFDKEVVHPHRLIQREFTPETEPVIYRHRNYRDYSEWQYPPVYMEFSHEALQRAHYCRLGWIVSATDDQCPMRNYCDDFTGGETCEHYAGPEPFQRLYSVYPGIEQAYQDPASENTKPGQILNYGQRPLCSIQFTESGEFQAFINDITFNATGGYIAYSPSVFTRTGIGFRTPNVHSLTFTFSEDVLQKLIKDLLKSNEELRRWMALKYKLYLPDDPDEIKDKGGFSAFDEMTEFVDSVFDQLTTDEEDTGLVDGSSDDADDADEDTGAPNLIRGIDQVNFEDDPLAMEFAEVIFLHSFSHILRDRLRTEYGCGEDELTYHIEHPDLGIRRTATEERRVVLFETAIGGFGYLDDLRREMRQGHGQEETPDEVPISLRDLLADIIDNIGRHVDARGTRASDFPDELDYETEDGSDSDLVQWIREAVQSFASEDIYPHPKSIRQVLYQHPNTEIDDDTQRAKLDNIFQQGPTCWDGCELCVHDDNNCSFLPWDIPFVLSRKLLVQTLESIIDQDPTLEPEYGVLDVYHQLRTFADSSIDLLATDVDDDIINELRDTATTHDLHIRLLIPAETWDGLPTRLQTTLNQACRETTFDCRRIEGAADRSRMFIDQSVLLSGEFPLAYNALVDEQPTAELNYDVREVVDIYDEWELSWEQASPISTIK